MSSKKEANVRFDSRITFPAHVLARPLRGDSPDNLLRSWANSDDIVVSIPLPLSEDSPHSRGDVLRLTIDGVPVGDAVTLPTEGDVVYVTLRAADRPLSTSPAPREVKINYEVEFRAAGITVCGPDDQRFMTLVRTPGGQSLAPLSFGPEVTKNGITKNAIVQFGLGREYVLAVVKGYYGAAAGDQVYGIIDGDERITTDPVFIDEAYAGGEIALRFPLKLLRILNGSVRGFSYRIVDRARNVSIAPPPVDVLIQLGPTEIPIYAARMYEAIDHVLATRKSARIEIHHDMSGEDEMYDLEDVSDEDKDEDDDPRDFARDPAVDAFFNEWHANQDHSPRPDADSAIR